MAYLEVSGSRQYGDKVMPATGVLVLIIGIWVLLNASNIQQILQKTTKFSWSGKASNTSGTSTGTDPVREG